MSGYQPQWTFRWPIGVNFNHQYARGRGGSVRLTDRAKAWRDEVILLVRTSEAAAPPGLLSLHVWLFEPDHRRRDTDGVLKLLQDAVCTGLTIDDSRIRGLYAERLQAPNADGRVGVVEVEIASWSLEWLEERLRRLRDLRGASQHERT